VLHRGPSVLRPGNHRRVDDGLGGRRGLCRRGRRRGDRGRRGWTSRGRLRKGIPGRRPSRRRPPLDRPRRLGRWVRTLLDDGLRRNVRLGRHGRVGRLDPGRGRRSRSRRGRARRLDGRRIRRRRFGRGGGDHARRALGRRRDGRDADRKERERIEVALRVGGRADSHRDVRLREGRIVGRADGCDRRALPRECASYDGDRAQVQERHGLPGRRLDRHRLAEGGHGACERHDALRRGAHGRADRCRDVDAAVLAGRVRVFRVEVEAAQHLTVHRPGPRPRGPNG
jgi:hypothetical protein